MTMQSSYLLLIAIRYVLIFKVLVSSIGSDFRNCDIVEQQLTKEIERANLPRNGSSL